MTLLLNRKDVEGLLSMDEATRVLEGLYVQEARGETTVHSPIKLHTSRSIVRMVSGGLDSAGVLGYRASVPSAIREPAQQTGEPAEVDRPSSAGIVLMFDLETGEPVCLMPSPSTTLRGAASMAVGIKWLAPLGAKTLAFIGTGTNAPSILRAAIGVRSVKDVRIYSRSAERRETLAKTMDSELPCVVRPVDSSPAAVDGADIIICSTNSTDPVFEDVLIKEPVHVSSFGFATEIPIEFYRRAELYATSVEQERQLGYYRHYVDHEFLHPLLDPSIPDHPALSEMINIGTVIAGTKQVDFGRPTVFREAQGGCGDIALAQFILDRARSLGRGTEITI